MKWWKFPILFALGIAFAVVLTKAQLISFVRIRRMFALTEPHLYLVIASAVAVALIGVLLVKALTKNDAGGEPYETKRRPMRFGIVAGGLLFGVGWYVTNACPGPIYVLIGNLQWPALLILVGAMVGALAFSIVKPRLKD
jgi:uncharacterized protein